MKPIRQIKKPYKFRPITSTPIERRQKAELQKLVKDCNKQHKISFWSSLYALLFGSWLDFFLADNNRETAKRQAQMARIMQRQQQQKRKKP